MRRTSAACLLLLAVGASGCASSLDQNYAFRRDNDRALIVYGASTQNFWVRRIVPELNHVTRINFSFLASNMDGNDVLGFLPAGRTYRVTLQDAGSYAVVGTYANTHTSAIPGGYVAYRCLDSAALAFKVDAGVINVIPDPMTLQPGSTFTATGAIEEVRTLLESWPNMTAPVRYAAFLGTISIPPLERIGLSDPTCGSGSSFSFIDR